MAIAAVALLVGGCKKDPAPTPPTPTDPYAEYTKVAELPIIGAGVNATLYMMEEPFVGYNQIFVVLKDSVTNVELTDAHVNFEPMMDMGTMMHSAPWEEAYWDETSKSFKGAITFIMPSTAGSWTLKVMVHNHISGNEGEGSTPITVVEKAEPRLFSFVSATDGAKIFVALVGPTKPKVGLNDFEVVVYNKASMMDFPAVDDLKIAIEPTMPSMGHGSPNNVNPTSIGEGHYKGVVNFTMTGYWEVALTIKDANNAMMYDQGFFGITL